MRLGMIGCGRAADRLYLPALRQTPGVTLTAVCDPSAARRDAIASQVDGCITADSPSAMLDAAALDAVLVLTPPELHLDTARPALERGLPVLIEKPLAPTIEHAEAIRDLARANDALVTVGFNRRWWAPVRQLIHAMREMTGPAELEMAITSDTTAWAPICGVRDALDDLASHHLDLAHAITGAAIEHLSAKRGDDGAVTLDLGLAGGHTARLLAAQRSPSTETISVRRAGHHRRIDLSSVRITPARGVRRRVLDFTDRLRRKCLRAASPMALSYRAQVAAFVRRVETGDDDASPEYADLHAGLHAVRAIDAARRSIAAGGRMMKLSHH